MSRVRILAVWFGFSFVLHFVWEHVQMPLYGLQHVAFWDGVWICLFATATGDMLFMLIIFHSGRLIWLNPPIPKRTPVR